MSIFNAFNSSASALTAQRLRMDVISSNIANAETTRGRINETGEFEPYRRKMTVFQEDSKDFRSFLHKASQNNNNASSGLKVSQIVEDQDRKSTRLNSSHVAISYAVFCLKKKNKNMKINDHM